MTTRTLKPDALARLIEKVLASAGVAPAAAASVAGALVAAEIDGQRGHGLSRLMAYAAQARSGKVDGQAVPVASHARAGALVVDAAHGFAFPAIDLAVARLIELAPQTGIAAAAIRRSHHFGVAGRPAERLAEHGLIGLVFGNSPAALAPWGGHRALFGTNPIAFAAPHRGGMPLVIDLSLSKVARGRIMVAAQKGEPIPEGLALDAEGRPTTDAEAALAGTVLPMGDAKGAALALMVEILAAALTPANFGFEASSFFTAEGDPPGVGQFMIAIDPAAFSGAAFADRIDVLIDAMVVQPGVRLPGARRLANRARVLETGMIEVDAQLLAEVQGAADDNGSP